MCQLNRNKTNWDNLNVSEHWNEIESLLINIIDKEAPLKSFEVNPTFNKQVLPGYIKRTINKRNRLLKSNNHTQSLPLVKTLNNEIKLFDTTNNLKF